MADVTVAQFAEVLKVPVDRLLTQLAEAGIKATSASDVISDDSKMTLLTHLRKSHGHAEGASNAPRKITLKRKTTSTLRTAGSQGRTHTVNVEVRKKRTYVNRDVLEEQARSEQEELDKVKREEEEAKLAVVREEENRLKAAEEAEKAAARKIEEDEQKKHDAEDAARKAVEQQTRTREEEERKRQDSERALREKREAREKEREKERQTRYGRKELHVATDSKGRRKQKKPGRRRMSTGGDGQHATGGSADGGRLGRVGPAAVDADHIEDMPVLLARDAAADRGMGRVKKGDAHETSVGPAQDRGRGRSPAGTRYRSS